jgi:hypothetical protein
MDYKVVICSHDRVHTLKKKTLATLERYNIPKDKIFIFVAESEEDTYRKELDGYLICPGELGLNNQRNAVTRHFEPDDHLFCLDDDITGFYWSINKKLHPVENLDQLIRFGFKTAIEEKCSLWSLYPVKNALWLKTSITVGLVFCYGCCFGVINKKDIQIDGQLKEDYERTLKFFRRDGQVLRINWAAPSQSYKKGKGGLSLYRTDDRERAECQALIAQYPEYARIRERKGRVDLTLLSKWSESFGRNVQ